MTSVAPPGHRSPLRGAQLRAELSQIAGDVLESAPITDLDTPLWLQGLDSIGAVGLLLTIEERLGITLDAETLVVHASIEAIARHIEQHTDQHRTRSDATRLRNIKYAPPDEGAALRRMRADAELPEDIFPRTISCAQDPACILLTGATGFLGSYLLEALLRNTNAHIICLVRPNGMDPFERVAETLAQYSLDASLLHARVRCIPGDLAASGLGLTDRARAELCNSVDTIFHAAADVDWVSSYDALRAANVIGTRELLRIACTSRPAAFHFVSSMAVCYATTGPRQVTEHSDPLTNLEGLQLGYARSKCVAETLVRAAAQRGLIATIHRPALIFGDSRTGASPTTDLVATLIKGCIELGAAPDLDWTMDCVAPDFAARAIVRLSLGEVERPRVTHLINDRARHWRECVLWMQLAGYSLRLLPYAEWAALVDAACRRGDCSLAPLRSFLLGRWSGDSALALPQLYENGRRSHALASDTNACLAKAGLRCPPLDTPLLDRVFERWSRDGFVQPSARWVNSAAPSPSVCVQAEELEEMVASVLRTHHSAEHLRIERFSARPLGSTDGIISELSAWRLRRTIGLFRCRVVYHVDGRVRKRVLLVKAKAEDRHVADIAQSLARLCGDRLGHAVTQYHAHLGIDRGHLRELAVATQSDARFVRHMPRVFGVVRDADRGRFALVMEQLRDPMLLDAVDNTSRWEALHIRAAVGGLAALHSVWHGREDALRKMCWLSQVPTTSRMTESSELWAALAEHAAPLLQRWGLNAFSRDHLRAVETVGQWWGTLEEGPRTLIHGDANPRNLAICQTRVRGRPRLRAYDWELATLAAPQRDLAELLCFVLPSDVAKEDVECWVTMHRTALINASGVPIDPLWWRAGFAAALRDFLINRLAMYALIQRVRPLPWLERVTRTCASLCKAYPIDV